MPISPADHRVLARFRQRLADAYGERVERAVLYGSRARGDGRPDSDFDVAVFIREPDRFALESRKLAEIEVPFLYEGSVIHAFPFPAEAYSAKTGFMAELRRDGIDF